MHLLKEDLSSAMTMFSPHQLANLSPDLSLFSVCEQYSFAIGQHSASNGNVNARRNLYVIHAALFSFVANSSRHFTEDRSVASHTPSGFHLSLCAKQFTAIHIAKNAFHFLFFNINLNMYLSSMTISFVPCNPGCTAYSIIVKMCYFKIACFAKYRAHSAPLMERR